ncbi:SDR family oxidoreductase [Rhizobium laguerreae]|nr:SDR family oxidoreductase [Rhizobium laguerreae]
MGIAVSFSEKNIPDLSGKTALVTGATGGLGFEMVRMLAGAGASVIVAGRNAQKGVEAVQRLRSLGAMSDITFEQVDLGSLESITGAAVRLSGQGKAIDILINNAGVMTPPDRRTTKDGFELQFGTNHLGHYALIGLLLPLLLSTQAPRVVTISSNAARAGKIHFDDLQFERRYRAIAAYSQSKLANLLFSRRLQQLSDERGWNLVSVAAHPGYARTNIIQNGPGKLRGLMRIASLLLDRFASHNAAAGALPAILAATGRDVSKFDYFGPTQLKEFKGPPGRVHLPQRACDDEVAQRLWAVSAALTGVIYPEVGRPT